MSNGCTMSDYQSVSPGFTSIYNVTEMDSMELESASYFLTGKVEEQSKVASRHYHSEKETVDWKSLFLNPVENAGVDIQIMRICFSRTELLTYLIFF